MKNEAKERFIIQSSKKRLFSFHETNLPQCIVSGSPPEEINGNIEIMKIGHIIKKYFLFLLLVEFNISIN